MNIQNNKFSINKLNITQLDLMVIFSKKLNPKKTKNKLSKNIREMFTYDNFMCLGLYYNNEIIGITNCWVSIRNYSGKQLELDNVIIDSKFQSKGFGEIFFNMIEDWAIKNNFETVELHTYIENGKSHKFYFNRGFKILGFHFQKQIN